MKKLTAIILSLTLVIASLSQTMVVAFADGEGTQPTITFTDAECLPGETVTVDVNISNNPGFYVLQLFKVNSYPDALGTPTATNGTLETAVTSGVSPLWDSSDGSADVTSNGKLGSLTFTIGTDVQPGEYTVNYTCTANNYDEEDVTFTIVPATITVKCPHTNTEVRDKVDATCVDEGYTGNTYCVACEEKISSGEVIPATGNHNYVEKVDAEYLVSAATCVSKAIYYKSCSVCGAASTETFETGDFDSSNHVGGTKIVGQEEATCIEEGYTGDTHCSSCNAKISDGQVIQKSAHNPASTWTTDATHHWHVCQTIGCGNITEKTEHSGGTATCTNKAVCEVCGVEYGEVDSSNHGEIEWKETKAATTTAEGEKTGTCKDCGEVVYTANIDKLSSAPISNKQIKTKMNVVKLEPVDALLPENAVFEAEEKDTSSLTEKEGEKANIAIEAVKSNTSIVGEGQEIEKVEVVGFYNFDLYTLCRDEKIPYDFDGSVKVTVDKSEAMKTAKNSCLVHIKDDGSNEVVGFVDNGDTITFVATGFSSYVVLDVTTVATENEQSSSNGDTSSNSSHQQVVQKSTTNSQASPQTGDSNSIVLWISLFVMASMGLAVTTFVRRKKER